MATQKYYIGALIELRGRFVNPDTSTELDPTAVMCDVLTPSSVTTTYVYGVDVELVKVSTGLYTLSVEATEPGEWQYRWYSTGIGQAAEERMFKVEETAF
jgi:hypothetical protein